jgi:hypothetical protein
MGKPQKNYLSVPEMAADIGVSRDKVSNWCATGCIEGTINIGDGRNRFYRVPRENWEAFKLGIATMPKLFARRHRYRPGTNLLGI